MTRCGRLHAQGLWCSCLGHARSGPRGTGRGEVGLCTDADHTGVRRRAGCAAAALRLCVRQQLPGLAGRSDPRTASGAWTFLDPRGVDDTGLSGYHFGIDVSIDDRHPEAGAPAGLSHRVYAVESGRVSEPTGDQTRPRLGASPIGTSPRSVASRAYVKAGQQIGWSCLGVWHVHVSEWQRFQGRQIWVNPLHRGGRIAPYVDTAAPVVNTLVFVTPPARPWLPTKTPAQPDSSTRLSPSRLHGLVELRANIGDPQFIGETSVCGNVLVPALLPVQTAVLEHARNAQRPLRRHRSRERPGREHHGKNGAMTVLALNVIKLRRFVALAIRSHGKCGRAGIAGSAAPRGSQSQGLLLVYVRLDALPA
jgi:hypothetical protein